MITRRSTVSCSWSQFPEKLTFSTVFFSLPIIIIRQTKITSLRQGHKSSSIVSQKSIYPSIHPSWPLLPLIRSCQHYFQEKVLIDHYEEDVSCRMRKKVILLPHAENKDAEDDSTASHYSCSLKSSSSMISLVSDHHASHRRSFSLSTAPGFDSCTSLHSRRNSMTFLPQFLVNDETYHYHHHHHHHPTSKRSNRFNPSSFRSSNKGDHRWNAEFSCSSMDCSPRLTQPLRLESPSSSGRSKKKITGLPSDILRSKLATRAL